MVSEQNDEHLICEHLSAVQRAIKAPKEREGGHRNSKYRNAEDIIEAVKQILPVGCSLTMSDEPFVEADRFFIKSCALFLFRGQSIFTYGFAELPKSEPNRCIQQTTGATMSYARRYALCGLFAIDNSDDIDSPENHEYIKQESKKKTPEVERVITIEQVLTLSQLVHDLKYDVKKLLERYKVGSLNDLVQSQFEHAMKGLKQLQTMEYAKV